MKTLAGILLLSFFVTNIYAQQPYDELTREMDKVKQSELQLKKERAPLDSILMQQYATLRQLYGSDMIEIEKRTIEIKSAMDSLVGERFKELSQDRRKKVLNKLHEEITKLNQEKTKLTAENDRLRALIREADKKRYDSELHRKVGDLDKEIRELWEKHEQLRQERSKVLLDSKEMRQFIRKDENADTYTVVEDDNKALFRYIDTLRHVANIRHKNNGSRKEDIKYSMDSINNIISAYQYAKYPNKVISETLNNGKFTDHSPFEPVKAQQDSIMAGQERIIALYKGKKLDDLPQADRNKLLIAVAKNTVLKYAPAYYRDGESIPPPEINYSYVSNLSASEEAKKREIGRYYYTITFSYDPTKEKYHFGDSYGYNPITKSKTLTPRRDYSSKVNIWADDGTIRGISAGGGWGLSFDGTEVKSRLRYDNIHILDESKYKVAEVRDSRIYKEIE